MKNILNAILILIILGSNNLYSQNKCNCASTINPYFFNLDLNSSDSILVEQINEIQDFKFVSTDKVDTIWLADSSNYFLFSTPEVIGMPNFCAQNVSMDEFNSDSLLIFLGGGSGILLIENDSMVNYNIETIEIIRDFNKREDALSTFGSISAKLNQLCDAKYTFLDKKAITNDYQWEFELEIGDDETETYLGKKVIVKFYLPRSNSERYTVNLTYEKWIKNTHNIN